MLVSYALLAIVYYFTLDKQSLLSLWQKPQRQTGVLSCAVVFALLWQIKAGILPHLDIHILGITAVTLVLGWRFASLSALIASLILLAFGELAVQQFPLYVFTTALIPIYFTYGVFLLAYTYLPRHLFIYIFVCAFLCAALAGTLKIISAATTFWFLGYYDWATLLDNYVILSALVWFPEAMLNGMAITLLSIYRPHWVRTFYDKDYLSQ